VEPTLVPALGEQHVVAIAAGWCVVPCCRCRRSRLPIIAIVPPPPTCRCRRGHSAIVDAGGALTLLGMPLDFRNTLRHINTRGSAPLLQRLMLQLSRRFFPADTAPAHHPSPEGDAFVAAEASAASLTGVWTGEGRPRRWCLAVV
jgi:hypothetical protein